MIKKIIPKAILFIILIDIIIGCALFKSRLFSHLAIWKIRESSKQSDFYWPPEKAPADFHLQEQNQNTAVFREDIIPIVKSRGSDFQAVLEIAKYVAVLGHSGRQESGELLKWDSPQGMLRQIKNGALGANCFHRSILFSSFLASAGFKSRLWALENKKFDSIAHTISEVYLPSLKKWVFMDVIFCFYVSEDDNFLSFLELRERLLTGNIGRLAVNNFIEIGQTQKQVPIVYKKLVQTVFLRTGNNFADRRPISRGFIKYANIFSNSQKVGIGYLFGEKEYFMHYVDKFSPKLTTGIILTRLLFYWFMLSLGSLFIVFLGKIFETILSRKDTRHR
jgi:hypothetical protein